jgi:hypothetical protein
MRGTCSKPFDRKNLAISTAVTGFPSTKAWLVTSRILSVPDHSQSVRGLFEGGYLVLGGSEMRPCRFNYAKKVLRDAEETACRAFFIV